MTTALFVTVSLATALAVPSLAACDDSAPEPPPAGESAEKPSKPTPMSCLKQVVGNPERRGKTLWRGFNPHGSNFVNIDKLASKARARRAVKQADLVVSEAVGRYFVHGPYDEADDGSTAAVADCLRGG